MTLLRFEAALALGLLASDCHALRVPSTGTHATVKGSRPEGSTASSLQLSRRSLFSSAALVVTSPLVAEAVSIDPDRYGDKELKAAAVNRVRQAVRDECGKDLNLLVPMLQLTLTDAFSFDGTKGGIDGSILREMGRTSTEGLDKAATIVKKIHSDLARTTEISYSDVVAFAGAAAIEAVGGPKITVQLGRDDVSAPEPEGGRAGFSWASPTVEGLKRMGSGVKLTGQELVALVGALALLDLAARPLPQYLDAEEDEDADIDADGKAAAAEVGGESAYTRYGKVNKKGPKSTSASYLADVKVAVDVRVQKIGNQAFDTTYFNQLIDTYKAKGSLTPLEAGLMSDPELRKTVEEFAKSKMKFRKMVTMTYSRLQLVGSNFVGAASFLDDSELSKE